jgi:hypothetical protein
MRYTLYINLANPAATYRGVPSNSGIEMVHQLLDQLSRRGETVQIRNTGEMNPEELMTAYISEAAVAAVYGKYRVRNVFGSNRRPGSAFGQGVPALSVRDASAAVAHNVYPHNASGRYVTIYEFLIKTLANPAASEAHESEKQNE